MFLCYLQDFIWNQWSALEIDADSCCSPQLPSDVWFETSNVSLLMPPSVSQAVPILTTSWCGMPSFLDLVSSIFAQASLLCLSPFPSKLMTNVPLFWIAETPFEDGSFRLTLTFTDAYPNKPPTVRFISKMFHPNIYANGELCLDILQNRWSPTYDVAAILTSVQSLLNDPNPARWA